MRLLQWIAKGRHLSQSENLIFLLCWWASSLIRFPVVCMPRSFYFTHVLRADVLLLLRCQATFVIKTFYICLASSATSPVIFIRLKIMCPTTTGKTLVELLVDDPRAVIIEIQCNILTCHTVSKVIFLSKNLILTKSGKSSYLNFRAKI